MTNQFFLTSEIGCSSFELRKMSKGYAWNIKIYNSNIEEAYNQAKKIDSQALTDYTSTDENKEESE